MIKSMTGFGKATVDCGTKKVIVEVKSLNSKQLDINLRTPSIYKEKDIEIRNMIKNVLERGKVDVYIYFDNAEDEKDVAVNQSVVRQYYNQMLEVADSLGVEINKSELLQTIMRFPDTMQAKMEELDEEGWNCLRSAIEKALSDVDDFRIQEGKFLIADILKRIELIKSLSGEVPQFEKQRVVTIKQRLQDKMKEWGEIKNIDENRLEQELSITWRNWISRKRKFVWQIIVNILSKPWRKKKPRGVNSDLSLKKSVAKSIPWVPKPMIMTSRNWLFA